VSLDPPLGGVTAELVGVQFARLQPQYSEIRHQLSQRHEVNRDEIPLESIALLVQCPESRIVILDSPSLALNLIREFVDLSD